MAVSSRYIHIIPSTQRLHCVEAGEVCYDVSVSTARLGLGEQKDSFQTPRGWHQVRAIIGQGQLKNTVFVGRRVQSEMYSRYLAELEPERDWILTRILWLSGLEPGVNRMGDVDSMRRFIYIHGTPDSEPLGQPLSHGCVRMHNHPLLKLCDWVQPYERVYIGESA